MAKRRIDIKHRPKTVKTTPTKKGGTHRNTWKHMERIVARFFGSERTPLSGGASRHTRSDSLHPDIFIESKFRGRLGVWDLYQDTKELAKLENKIPLVVLKKKGEHGYLLLLDIKHLRKLAELKIEDDGTTTGKKGD